MNVLDWKNTDLNNLKLKSSYMTSKSKIILSSVKYLNQNLIYQTPPALVLKKIPNNIYGKKFYKIALFYEYYTFNKKAKDFIEKIIMLEKFLINKYRKLLTNHIFNPSIKISKSTDDAFFNVNIQIFNSKLVLPIFDYKKTSQSPDYILPRSKIINIVYLKDMWRVNNRVGFNWVLLQTKVHLPFLYIKRCLIEDELINIDTSKIDNIDNSSTVYNKYIKMRKFGVPEEAIKRELQKNNLSYTDFTNYKPIKNISKVMPIKKPMINPGMLRGIKLKKPKKRRKKKPTVKKNILANIDTKNYRPPTTETLAELIKNLKKQPVEMPHIY